MRDEFSAAIDSRGGTVVNRRLARESVLQALYAHTMGGGNRGHVVATIIRPRLKEDGSILQFAERLFAASFETATRADMLIKAHADNWELVRMAILDRLVLRMAICEFLSFEHIPPKVTINEAIDIGKRFSTDGSGQFINGMLDAIVYELQQKGELRKSGRGLKGMEELIEKLARRSGEQG